MVFGRSQINRKSIKQNRVFTEAINDGAGNVYSVLCNLSVGRCIIFGNRGIHNLLLLMIATRLSYLRYNVL